MIMVLCSCARYFTLAMPLSTNLVLRETPWKRGYFSTEENKWYLYPGWREQVAIPYSRPVKTPHRLSVMKSNILSIKRKILPVGGKQYSPWGQAILSVRGCNIILLMGKSNAPRRQYSPWEKGILQVGRSNNPRGDKEYFPVGRSNALRREKQYFPWGKTNTSRGEM